MELSQLHIYPGPCTVRPICTAIPLQSTGALRAFLLSVSCGFLALPAWARCAQFSGMLSLTSADVVCQVAPTASPAQLSKFCLPGQQFYRLPGLRTPAGASTCGRLPCRPP